MLQQARGWADSGGREAALAPAIDGEGYGRGGHVSLIPVSFPLILNTDEGGYKHHGVLLSEETISKSEIDTGRS